MVPAVGWAEFEPRRQDDGCRGGGQPRHAVDRRLVEAHAHARETGGFLIAADRVGGAPEHRPGEDEVAGGVDESRDRHRPRDHEHPAGRQQAEAAAEA
jgi:hypothetical protein